MTVEDPPRPSNGGVRYEIKELISQLDARLLRTADMLQAKADREATKILDERVSAMRDDIIHERERLLKLEEQFNARLTYGETLIGEFRTLQQKVENLEVLAERVTRPAIEIHARQDRQFAEVNKEAREQRGRIETLEKEAVTAKELRSNRVLIYTMLGAALVNLVMNTLQEIAGP